MNLEELLFKRVNGQTGGRWKKVITIAHPEHSSVYLKIDCGKPAASVKGSCVTIIKSDRRPHHMTDYSGNA